MGFQPMRLNFQILMLLLLPYGVAQGVTSKELLDRFTLVGVITTDDSGSSNIAVLKDSGSRKSLFVKEGEYLRNFRNFRVERVTPKVVFFSDGRQEVMLKHPGFPKAIRNVRRNAPPLAEDEVILDDSWRKGGWLIDAETIDELQQVEVDGDIDQIDEKLLETIRSQLQKESKPLW